MDQPEVTSAVDYGLLSGPRSKGSTCRNLSSYEVDFLQTDPPTVDVTVDHQRLAALESAMLTRPEDILEGGRLYDPQEVHLFPPGLYVRQVTNPAGSLTVTMKHKTEHPFFVLRGRLRIKDLATGEVRELRSGDAGVTPAGTQRVILALEETVFVTVHPNPDDCRDLAVLEERFIERQELPGGRTARELYRQKLRLLEGEICPG